LTEISESGIILCRIGGTSFRSLGPANQSNNEQWVAITAAIIQIDELAHHQTHVNAFFGRDQVVP
jgi:hypothetical protein